jgi:hypothetical protein
MKCETCDKEHDGKFGSGRFCSSHCARGYATLSRRKQINKKVSLTLKNKIRACKICGRQIKGGWTSQLCKECRQKKHTHVCEKCGNTFIESLKSHRRKQCKECRRHSKRGKREVKSILELPRRTISKILRRARISCVICGWNKSSCDIHHIIPRKFGSNDENNLVIVCPNCHREIHNEKKISEDFLRTLTIEKNFKNWKDFYYY